MVSLLVFTAYGLPRHFRKPCTLVAIPCIVCSFVISEHVVFVIDLAEALRSYNLVTSKLFETTIPWFVTLCYTICLCAIKSTFTLTFLSSVFGLLFFQFSRRYLCHLSFLFLFFVFSISIILFTLRLAWPTFSPSQPIGVSKWTKSRTIILLCTRRHIPLCLFLGLAKFAAFEKVGYPHLRLPSCCNIASLSWRLLVYAHCPTVGN